MGILIFADQNAASSAVQKIGRAMALTGSTFLFALPAPLVDGRWFIPAPSDPAWLGGVSGYVEADGVGMAPVGEGAVHVPLSVTNAQARAVMRQTYLPSQAESLFTLIDARLRRARDDAAVSLAESDPTRIQADTAWNFWEQANEFDRNGALVTTLAEQFGLGGDELDRLFVAAAAVTA